MRMMCSDTWLICPECRSQIRDNISPGRFVGCRCSTCHRRFRAYAGKALLFGRKRHPEDTTYYAVLSGAIVPRLFIIRDETQNEMIINRGDMVVVSYRGDRLAIVQNLSASTYWAIHSMRPLGCLALLACVMAAAGIVGLLAIWLTR